VNSSPRRVLGGPYLVHHEQRSSVGGTVMTVITRSIAIAFTVREMKLLSCSGERKSFWIYGHVTICPSVGFPRFPLGQI
jgi:hypothetical protein